MNKHGGAREGAGRKKGVETDTISFRVPKDQKDKFKELPKEKKALIKQKVTEFIKTELKK